MIEIRQISSKKDKKKFFKFVCDLYKDVPQAAPNLFLDEFAEFDPETNDAFRFADCKMFLAYRDKKIVGRVAGIWHRGANDKGGVKQLRFTRFDVIDDFEVTKALFSELVKWAKELGMTEIIGPISFSDLNEEGMLIEGFDRDSTYIEPYNFPYYVEHMERLGAKKAVDWHCYRIKVPEKKDERIAKLAASIAQKEGYSVLDVAYLKKHDKKKLNGYIMQCLEILDDVFSELYGTSPLNEKQMQRETDTINLVLKPEFAAVIMHGEEVVAYGFMIPSMLKVMHKARGKLFPRGIIPYLQTMRHCKVAELLSIGVKRDHANRGAAALILDHCLDGLISNGITEVEAGPELEENRRVQNLWKNFDRELCKKLRCWTLDVAELEEVLKA